MKPLMLVLVLAGALLSGCVPSQFAGLTPLDPVAPEFVTTSPNPVLRWQELPAAGRTDVVYDLRLYEAGSPLFSVDGLVEPSHRLEVDLKPGVKYEWTVRARYRVDGSRRRTEWTEREDTWSRDGTLDERRRQYVPLSYVPER